MISLIRIMIYIKLQSKICLNLTKIIILDFTFSNLRTLSRWSEIRCFIIAVKNVHNQCGCACVDWTATINGYDLKIG